MCSAPSLFRAAEYDIPPTTLYLPAVPPHVIAPAPLYRTAHLRTAWTPRPRGLPTSHGRPGPAAAGGGQEGAEENQGRVARENRQVARDYLGRGSTAVLSSTRIHPACGTTLPPFPWSEATAERGPQTSILLSATAPAIDAPPPLPNAAPPPHPTAHPPPHPPTSGSACGRVEDSGMRPMRCSTCSSCFLPSRPCKQKAGRHGRQAGEWVTKTYTNHVSQPSTLLKAGRRHATAAGAGRAGRAPSIPAHSHTQD